MAYFFTATDVASALSQSVPTSWELERVHRPRSFSQFPFVNQLHPGMRWLDLARFWLLLPNASVPHPKHMNPIRSPYVTTVTELGLPTSGFRAALKKLARSRRLKPHMCEFIILHPE